MIERDPQTILLFKRGLLDVFGIAQADVTETEEFPSLMDNDDFSEMLRSDWNELPIDLLEAILGGDKPASTLTFIFQHRTYILGALKNIYRNMSDADAEHVWQQMIPISRGVASMLIPMPSGIEYSNLRNDNEVLELINALYCARCGSFTRFASIFSQQP